MIRPLGAFERLLFAMNENRATHFVLGFEVEGAVEQAALAAALQSLQARHPLLACTIRPNCDGILNFSQATAARIPVRLAPHRGVQSWPDEAELELGTAFDTARAPLVRVVLAQRTSGALLFFACHHSVADGRGVLFLLRDLLLALSGAHLDPSATPPSRESLIRQQLGVAEITPPFSSDDPPPNRYVAPDAKPQVCGCQLDRPLTSAVQARARSENTSVHGAICAALARTGADELNGRDGLIRFDSPIDCRKLLDAGENCAPLLTPGKARCDLGTTQGFWTLARSIRRQMAEGSSPDALRANGRGLEQLMSTDPDADTIAAAAAKGFSASAIITNLGVIPLREIGNFRVQAIYGPALSLGFDNVQTIGVSTTNGCLDLTLTSFAPPASLLEKIKQQLEAAVWD